MWPAGTDGPQVAAGQLGGDPIVIGFVNNMPDAALQRTERQFRALLAATPHGHRVRLRPFFLPAVPRSEDGRAHVERHYESIDALWASRVDALIVTGNEPRMPVLTDEPYWDGLARLVDWAGGHTLSTIWSCLAAHAAVLHLDGIERRPLGRKLSGVFTCRKLADHPLLAGVPAEWPVPHSRYNGLPEERLARAGYALLSTSPDAGLDVFIKQRASLFVFLHGHPEYDATALAREYRRDVTRFLSDWGKPYPDVPEGYFDGATVAALAAFRRRAVGHRGSVSMADMPAIISEAAPRHTWNEPATRIFSNWLSHLTALKSQRGGLQLRDDASPPRALDRPPGLQAPPPVSNTVPDAILAR